MSQDHGVSANSWLHCRLARTVQGHLRGLSPYAFGKDSSIAEVNSWRMLPTIEKISAVTFRVANMTESVRFYRDVLGMELLYGGEDAGFSSLRAKDAQSAILNLEQGNRVTRRGGRSSTSRMWTLSGFI
jgi:hypothetical protein